MYISVKYHLKFYIEWHIESDELFKIIEVLMIFQYIQNMLPLVDIYQTACLKCIKFNCFEP